MRRYSSTCLIKAKEEYERRRDRGEATTTPVNRGCFADATVASRSRVAKTIHAPNKSSSNLDLGPLPKLDKEPSKYWPADRFHESRGKGRMSPTFSTAEKPAKQKTEQTPMRCFRGMHPSRQEGNGRSGAQAEALQDLLLAELRSEESANGLQNGPTDPLMETRSQSQSELLCLLRQA